MRFRGPIVQGAVFLAALLAAQQAHAETVVARPDGKHVLENDLLRVAVSPQTGAIEVLDKRNARVWRQPAASAGDVAIPKLTAAPTIDGDLSEWTGPPLIRLTHDMTADSKQVDNDEDCSASIWCGWDDRCFYVAARVRDEVLDFGPWAGLWWQRDAFEFWIGDILVPIELNPASPGVAKEGGGLSVTVVVHPDPKGYAFELAVPWTNFPAADKPQPGERFRFAMGVDDSDGTGARQGQLYFPPTRRHAVSSTFAWAALAGTDGTVPEPPPPAKASFRDMRPTPGANGLAFEADFGETNGRANTFDVSLTLADGAPDLRVVADAKDHDVALSAAPFLESFVLETPQGVVAMADYCDGHVYPLDTTPFPKPYQAVSGLDMPWVGLCDLEKGFGYSIIVEDPEDADLSFEPKRAGDRMLAVPRIVWQGSMGKYACPRRLLYHFASEGGYVALAKRYRAYAKDQGLLVTLEEKAKKNPNVGRLFGAIDTWGSEEVESCARQMKAAGIERMIVHTGGRGKPSAEALGLVGQLGYLSGQYDVYADALPLAEGATPDYQHDRVPENACLDAQGTRMVGWVTLEGQKYYKRCPTKWMPAAQADIPGILSAQPFTARFIDVATAEGLYECYDPAHIMARKDKRKASEELLDYVSSLGLVVGGEHGKWWAVPRLAYLEGMMSAYYWFWPAGHLVKPKTKEDKFGSVPVYPLFDWKTYEKWDIGHRWRAPLWELVFHDCVVTTWYWGDTNLWLQQAAPEVTPKKELFNLLYGTMPMFWRDDWQDRRELLLRTYWTAGSWHEAVAGSEMVSHEFLTADHGLQRTRFSNGAEIAVNFGDKPENAALDRETYVLPPNGFAARAPGIELRRELKEGAPLTTVHSGAFFYSNAGGSDVALRRRSEREVNVWLGPSSKPVTLPVNEVVHGLAGAHVEAFLLGAEGERLDPVDVRPGERGGFEVGPFDKFTALVVLVGARS